MATMNVSLPDDMKSWIEAQANAARYSNTSDFVRDLVRREQERRAGIARLQQLIDEGLASGPGRLHTIDAIKAEARRRYSELQPPA